MWMLLNFQQKNPRKISPCVLKIPYKSHQITISTTEFEPTKKPFLNFVFSEATIAFKAPDSSSFLFRTRLCNKDKTVGRKCRASQKSSSSTIFSCSLKMENYLWFKVLRYFWIEYDENLRRFPYKFFNILTSRVDFKKLYFSMDKTGSELITFII